LNKILRPVDFVVLFLTMAITVFCAVRIYGKNESALRFVIEGKNGNWIYPLNQTTQIDIPGPLGNTVIELKEGRARVVSSPCANQTCVCSPPIRQRGQWIACLPNAVFIRVDSAGGDHADVDTAVW
jgi:hypothetical protein